MSVFGVDFGNLYSTVSVARRGGIDVIINEVSKRETSTFVSFGGEKEGRMIGEKGADMKIRNWRNTVTHLKRLVGIKFDSDAWRAEAQHCSFRTVEGPNGFVNVEVDFCGETLTLAPEQLIAMMLGKLRSYADREFGEEHKGVSVKVVDCVLACPAYYSVFQRKLLMQATEIAGLNCLTLVTEGTAVAIQYGIFKSESLPEKEEDGAIVLFTDMGHSCTYITAVKFWKGNLKVIGHVYDKNLGCRDFDLALADYFRGEIQTKYKMDVYEQKKAKIRLLAGCEKLRYTLSANSKASLNVECIMDDVDISFATYERSHFEELSAPLWRKMEELVQRATQLCEIEKVQSIELVGGGSYMPKVRDILSTAFKKSISTTLNASEAVAKGCGIIGAILSPRFHVKDFGISDALVHEIKVGYLSPVNPGPSPVSFITDISKETVLYKAGAAFPNAFDLSFDRKSNFDLYTYYKEPCAEVSAANGSLLLGHWTFSDIPQAKDLQGQPEDKTVRVVVRFKMNQCGIISVDSATVKESYEVEEEVERKVEKKAEEPKEGEEKKEEEKKDEKPEMEKIKVKKTKTRTLSVSVTPHVTLGLPTEVADKMAKDEARMSANDQMIIETVDARNNLEGYAYEFRGKAEEGGTLFDYMTSATRDSFKKECDAAADWCYGEGEEATKDQYVAKLNELRKPGDEAVARLRAREELPGAFSSAEKIILGQMDEANKLLGTETHIEKEKLNEIVSKANEAREFLVSQKKEVEATPLNTNLGFSVSSVRDKADALVKFAKPIFATPKPTPPKEEKKEEEKKDEEKKDEKPAGDVPPQPAGMDVD